MKQQHMPHIVILGAGVSGLGAAWGLRNNHYTHFHVYESLSVPGGLSSSSRDSQGFTWDIGGHVFHYDAEETYKTFVKILHGAINTFSRHAGVQIDSRMVSYPFQHALRELPGAIRKECERSLPTPEKNTQVHSFYDWILNTFGAGMAKHFFVPYNTKMWHYPLRALDWQWVDAKIPLTAKNTVRRWGSNAKFFVPQHGGVGRVWEALAQKLSKYISYNRTAIRIDGKKKIVYFSDGSQTPYDLLYSTIPLTSLANTLVGVSLPDTSGLQKTGIAVIGLGMEGKPPPALRGVHWVYVPSGDMLPFRFSVYSNYGSGYAPPGTWSLLSEISFQNVPPGSKDALIDDVIQSFQTLGYISKHTKIISRWYHETLYAYPVPTRDRDAILARILPVLATHGIFTGGRFGLWKYESGNMDHAFSEGIRWAQKFGSVIR